MRSTAGSLRRVAATFVFLAAVLWLRDQPLIGQPGLPGYCVFNSGCQIETPGFAYCAYGGGCYGNYTVEPPVTYRCMCDPEIGCQWEEDPSCQE